MNGPAGRSSFFPLAGYKWPRCGLALTGEPGGGQCLCFSLSFSQYNFGVVQQKRSECSCNLVIGSFYYRTEILSSLYFKNIYLFIYLFDCAGSQLRQAGSSVATCELLAVAVGSNSWARD